MRKTARKMKSGFLAAMCLAAFFSFAPLMAQAGTCSCNGSPTPKETDCNSAADCAATCGQGVTATCEGGSSDATSGGGTATQPKGLDNPLGAICGSGDNAIPGQKCVQLIIGNVIRAALGICGSIALLMMTWGGFLWLTSMGNNEKVEKGKSTLIWSTLGLVLIFGAYALTSYIINAIATGGGK